jgi:anti-anti-sigma factor
MRFETTTLHPGLRRLTLDGRLDAAGVQAIDLAFTATASAGGTAVLVDLSGVDFVASLGIRLLLSNAQVLRRRGLAMVICGTRPAVKEVFDTVALDRIIPCVEDEAAALALVPG